MNHEIYINLVFKEAYQGIKKNHGGPFAALILFKDGSFVKAHNEFIKRNDPTAHAEILALRKACQIKKTYHLEEAIIYSTSEPCPMCLSALYWGKISKIYYVLDRKDAHAIRFIDQDLYKEINKKKELRNISCEKIIYPEAKKLFYQWNMKEDKILY